MFVPAFLALWWPKIDRKSGFPQFSRKLSARFISSQGFILMGKVSGPLSIFVFVPSFLALWWPKIDRKSGFPQLFAKTVGSIHFIPGIYTYGVSLWTPIDFRVRAFIFGPPVAKNWSKIGVSATFRENFFYVFPNFLYQLQPRYLPYHDTLVGRVMPKFFSNKFFLNDSHQCSYHNDLKIGLFVGYFLMGWVLIRAGVYCPHL